MAKPLKLFLIQHMLSAKGAGRAIVLTPEETHHLKNVLRFRENDFCLLKDPEGNEAKAQVTQFLKNGAAVLTRSDVIQKLQRHSPRLSVAQAIPQHGKMDEIAEQAAELGIFELIPVMTERTIARPKGEKIQKVQERWQRISAQAVKQSRAERPPQIHELIDFSKLCRKLGGFDLCFLLDPEEPSALSCAKLDFDKIRKVHSILLIIGPEGGFSDMELTMARGGGAKIVRMNTPILKTNTAFAAGAGFFQIMLGE